MKRILAGIAVLASLIVAASPVVAADTYHYRNRGAGLVAFATNEPDAEELPAGTYYEVWVDASGSVTARGETIDRAVCVDYYSFTIGEDGEWLDEDVYSTCAEADVLKVNRQLRSGRVAATIPIMACPEWDEEQEECIGEWVEIATLEVEVVATGVGRINRYHGTESGGTAGWYQYNAHRNGMERAATVDIEVRLDGEDLITDATYSGGGLWRAKTGWIEIVHCAPRADC